MEIRARLRVLCVPNKRRFITVDLRNHPDDGRGGGCPGHDLWEWLYLLSGTSANRWPAHPIVLTLGEDADAAKPWTGEVRVRLDGMTTRVLSILDAARPFSGS